MSWGNRRRHDLAVSHRLAEYVSVTDREHAAHLIVGIVECEQLVQAVERAGGDAEDLARIEDTAWPLRETLRQLDHLNRMPGYVRA